MDEYDKQFIYGIEQIFNTFLELNKQSDIKIGSKASVDFTNKKNKLTIELEFVENNLENNFTTSIIRCK